MTWKCTFAITMFEYDDAALFAMLFISYVNTHTHTYTHTHVIWDKRVQEGRRIRSVHQIGRRWDIAGGLRREVVLANVIFMKMPFTFHILRVCTETTTINFIIY